MPAAVKIKAGKYGSAIGLLLERGGAFQTRHQRTLIVNAAQKKVLEEADLVETNGFQKGSGKGMAANFETDPFTPGRRRPRSPASGRGSGGAGRPRCRRPARDQSGTSGRD